MENKHRKNKNRKSENKIESGNMEEDLKRVKKGKKRK